MKKLQTIIEKGHTFDEYKNKYGKYYSLLHYTILEINDYEEKHFGKLPKRFEDYELLKNRSWWLISEDFFETPKTRKIALIKKRANQSFVLHSALLGFVAPLAGAIPVLLTTSCATSIDVSLDPTCTDKALISDVKTNEIGDLVFTLKAKISGETIDKINITSNGYEFVQNVDFSYNTSSFQINIVQKSFNEHNGKIVVKVTTKIEVSGVSLDRTNIDIDLDGGITTDKLSATISPSNATYKDVTWTSDNPNVIKVDDKGNLTALGVGSAIISVKTKDNNKTASCTVNAIKKVKGVEIEGEETKKLIIDKNDESLKSTILKAIITPSDAFNKKVTWSLSSSSDSAYLSLEAQDDGTCLAKALKNTLNDVKVIVKTEDGEKNDFCFINITTHVSEINIDKKTLSLVSNGSEEEKTSKINVLEVLPNDASNKEVSFTSSNSEIVSVDQDGNVLALKAGEADISVTAKDGSEVSTTCKVTVTSNVESIDISPKDFTLHSNDETLKEQILNIVLNPEDSNPPKNISWEIIEGGEFFDLSPIEGTLTAKVISKENVTGGGSVKVIADGLEATTSFNIITDTKEIYFDKPEIDLYRNSAEQKRAYIKAIVSPTTATGEVTYSIKEGSEYYITIVPQLDGSCLVKLNNLDMLYSGTAYVIATSGDGKKTCECKINFSFYPVKVSFTDKAEQLILILNDSEKNKANLSSYEYFYLSPLYSSYDHLEWSSSDTNIATIDESGIVNGVANGKCNITCKVYRYEGDEEPLSVTLENLRVETAIKNVTLKDEYIELFISGSESKEYKEEFSYEPSDIVDPKINWSSSDSDKVSVSQDGVIKAYKNCEGVTITISVEDALGNVVKDSLTVKASVIAKEIDLVADNTYIESNSDNRVSNLSVSFTPETVFDEVYWEIIEGHDLAYLEDFDTHEPTNKLTSFNDSVGKVVIRVNYLKDPTIFDTIEIEINKGVTEIVLDKYEITLDKTNNTSTIVASVLPSDAGDQNIIWISEDENIAKVDSEGNVSYVGVGYTRIIAKSSDTHFGKDIQKVCEVYCNATVTFDANGGVCETENIVVKPGEKISSYPLPTKEGFNFFGWFDALEEGHMYDENTIINSDVTLYAHWYDVKTEAFLDTFNGSTTNRSTIKLDIDSSSHVPTFEYDHNIFMQSDSDPYTFIYLGDYGDIGSTYLITAIFTIEGSTKKIDILITLTNSAFNFELDKDSNTYKISLKADYQNSINNVVIPRTYNKTKVTEVSEDGFKNSFDLESLEFSPNSNILILGNSSFLNSHIRNDLIIPKSVEIIDDFAFYANPFDSLTFEEESSLKTIGSRAFDTCRQLNEISLPDSIETLGDYFVYFDYINRIHINDISRTWSVYTLRDKAVRYDLEFTNDDTRNAEIFKENKTYILRHNIMVTEIKFDKTEYTAVTGDKTIINASILPENATVKTLNFVSLGTDVVKVDDDGNVIAVGPGKTSIAASSLDGGSVFASCDVTVLATLIFDGRGGTPSEEKIIIGPGEILTNVPTCNYDDRIFLGWYTSPDTGGEPFDFAHTKIYDDYHFYAHWLYLDGDDFIDTLNYLPGEENKPSIILSLQSDGHQVTWELGNVFSNKDNETFNYIGDFKTLNLLSYIKVSTTISDIEYSFTKKIKVINSGLTFVLDEGGATYSFGGNNIELTCLYCPRYYVNDKGVILPVTSILEKGFYNSKISSIIFSEDSQIMYIGDYAFAGTKLKSFVAPISLEAIGDYAFINVVDLSSFSSDLSPHYSYYSKNLFNGCSSLTSFTVGQYITSIESSAFAFCENLTSINFPNATKISWTIHEKPETIFMPSASGEDNAAKIKAIPDALLTRNIMIEKITLSETSVKGISGETRNISFNVNPNNATYKNQLSFISSDPSVATLDMSGVLKLIKPGKVRIIVSAIDGSNVSATLDVNVQVVVTFVKNNGEADSIIRVDINNKVSSLDVKKAYSAFIGWFTKEQNLFDFDTLLTENITLYAYFNTAIPEKKSIDLVSATKQSEVIGNTINLSCGLKNIKYTNITCSSEDINIIYYEELQHIAVEYKGDLSTIGENVIFTITLLVNDNISSTYKLPLRIINSGIDFLKVENNYFIKKSSDTSKLNKLLVPTTYIDGDTSYHVQGILENGFKDVSTLKEVYFFDGHDCSFGKGAFINCVSLASFTFASNISKDIKLIIPESMFENCSKLGNINIISNITKIEKNAFKNSILTTASFAYCEDVSWTITYSDSQSVYMPSDKKINASMLLNDYNSWTVNTMVKEIKIKESEKTLNYGEDFELLSLITISPIDATYKSFIFTSSDDKVVSIDKQTGKVIYVGPGSASISIQSDDLGKARASIDLNIRAMVKIVSNNGQEDKVLYVDYGGFINPSDIPSDPTKADSIFLGWYKNDKDVDTFDFHQEIKECYIVNAHWLTVSKIQEIDTFNYASGYKSSSVLEIDSSGRDLKFEVSSGSPIEFKIDSSGKVTVSYTGDYTAIGVYYEYKAIAIIGSRTYEIDKLNIYLDNSGLVFNKNSDGTYTLSGNKKDSTTLNRITIPNTYLGASITSISPNAFENFTSLAYVEFLITSSLLTIGSHAFYNCSNLSNDIIIPELVSTIGEGAFTLTNIKHAIFKDENNVTWIINDGEQSGVIDVSLDTSKNAETLKDEVHANFKWTKKK